MTREATRNPGEAIQTLDSCVRRKDKTRDYGKKDNSANRRKGIATNPGFLVWARNDMTRDYARKDNSANRWKGIDTNPGFLVGARNDKTMVWARNDMTRG